MGPLLLILSICFGLAAIRRLPARWYLAEWLAAGVTAGLLAGSFLAAAVSLVLPYAWSLPLTCALLAGGTLACRPWRAGRSLEPLRAAAPAWILLTGLGGGGLYALFSFHMLAVGADGWYSGGPTWADIAVHLTLATHFAAGSRLILDSPIYAGAKLSYPFLIDFLSAILYRSGWSLRLAFLVPGFLLALSFLQLFFFMALRLFRSSAAALLALALFLVNGTYAGTWSFLGDWAADGWHWRFLAGLSHDYTYAPGQGLYLYNILLSAVLPQRGTLFGFPAFCLTVILLYLARTAGPKRPLLLAAAVLGGLLPFAHPHTLAVVGVVWLAYLALEWREAKRPPADALLAFGLLLVLALPQAGWQLWVTVGSGFTRFNLGWMTDPGANPLIFWLRNAGLLLGVIGAMPFLPYRREAGFLRALTGSMLAVFILVNLAIFQPNPYDDSKLLVYAMLVADTVLAWALVEAVRRRRWSLLVAVPLVAWMLLAGAIDLIPERNLPYRFVSSEDIAFAAAVKAAVPPGSLVLTADTHNHPVPTLTGLPVLMGYRGWLWSYGIDYSQRELDESDMFRLAPDADALFRRYGVSYAVIGPDERSQWLADPDAFAARYPTVYRDGRWTVVKVR